MQRRAPAVQCVQRSLLTDALDISVLQADAVPALDAV
jgi:hypothetical protein